MSVALVEEARKEIQEKGEKEERRVQHDEQVAPKIKVALRANKREPAPKLVTLEHVFSKSKFEFLKCIKERFSAEPSVFDEFITTLQMYKDGGGSIVEANERFWVILYSYKCFFKR